MAKDHKSRTARLLREADKNDSRKDDQDGGGSLDLGVTGDPAFQVFMNFKTPVPGLTFTPDQAESIGVALIQRAAQARAMAAQALGPSFIRNRSN